MNKKEEKKSTQDYDIVRTRSVASGKTAGLASIGIQRRIHKSVLSSLTINLELALAVGSAGCHG